MPRRLLLFGGRHVLSTLACGGEALFLRGDENPASTASHAVTALLSTALPVLVEDDNSMASVDIYSPVPDLRTTTAPNEVMIFGSRFPPYMPPDAVKPVIRSSSSTVASKLAAILFCPPLSFSRLSSRTWCFT